MRILSIFAAVAAVFATRGALADEMECITPSGDFTNSCSDIAINKYLSSDPNLPSICQLTALCPTMYSGLPLQSNEVFIPTELKLVDVTNNNGTLTHNGKPLSGKTSTSSTDPEHCFSPQGSYLETCAIFKKPYISTDQKLSSTDLCEARLECATLNGAMTSNILFFNIRAKDKKSIEKIENCNGKLKKGKFDNECQTHSDTIQKIAQESCKTTLSM